MLTKKDIDWLESELVPALSGQVKKDLSKRPDSIATMLDKQSGNLQSIETELTLIRGSLETHTADQSTLIKRIEKVEKRLHIPAAA